MTKTLIGEKDRRIVPRWRGFSASAESATDARIASIPQKNKLSSSMLQNFTDWRDNPSLWNALDFIADAIVENRLDLAEDALRQVRSDPRLPAAASTFLMTATGGIENKEIKLLSSVEEEASRQIHVSRQRLAHHHWDAMEWADLARSFTSLGQIEKAVRCILAAVKLAPANRFVTRAACRFFVHIKDPERALSLLRKANTLGDPWLMAPQIAISSMVRKEAVFARDALRMLKQDFADKELCELGAALGTLEAENGKVNHAKKLLRAAISGANENTVAQIEWLNRSMLGDVIDVSSANPPRLYESGAWSSFIAGDWGEASRLSRLWFRDQPFSGNAAVVSSYVLADMLKEFEEAASVLATALRCNPGHVVLLNNLAYCLINLNQLSKAGKILSALPADALSINTNTADATRGLLAFRMGEFDRGRGMFLDVIRKFVDAGESDQAGRAATSLAFEELRADTPQLLEAVQRALELTKDSKASNVVFQVRSLEVAVRDYVARSSSKKPAINLPDPSTITP